MAQEFQYFYEDEVYRLNQKGQLEMGMVLENAEFVSSDDESDLDEDDKVTKGNIRVAWYPSGEEQVLPERKVGLGDRSLMPGDVVRRLIKGKDTQRGYCRQVRVSASVHIVGTKFVIVNVDSGDLTPLEEFTTDIAVALDSWVGMVNMVKCKLVMVTPDGVKCIMSDHEALHLDDVRDTRERDSEFRRYDFYPGQQLIGHSKLFEDAEWTYKDKEKDSALIKNQKLIRVTVEEVKVVQLGVRWQCRAFSNDLNFDKEQPKYNIQGNDLKRVKMLNVFEPCTLQLGDRNYYVMKECDLLLTRDQWRKLTANTLLGDTSNPCPLRYRFTNRQKKLNSRIRDKKTNSVIKPSSDDVSPPTNDVTPPIDSGAPPSDSDADFIDIDTDNFSDTASISSDASTGSQPRRNKKGPTLMTKMLKKRKLKRAKRKSDKTEPEVTSVKPGDKLVVETLMTSSRADVVWQDGSVEKDIPSTVLYPIHHLDDQEFFPGDLVVEQRDSVDAHEYGVVQRVEHAGRTAFVNWFHTYTAGSDPMPCFKYEQEVSVYDLRDHPDFRYRPGSVVIRVANFENGQICPTGQVLDNFPTGQVSVWWVDGSQSLCYPQDLYKVGEYDSDEGELWDDTASDQSWETESEHSTIAEESETENDTQLKTKLVANIEKARIAMSRLEEIFTQNPSLQTTAVMKQLIDCYKECRSIDKLMGTSYFHEDNFQGLIERVRERGRASTNQRMAEQFNRLFSTNSEIEEAMAINALTLPMTDEHNGFDTEEKEDVTASKEVLTSLSVKNDIVENGSLCNRNGNNNTSGNRNNVFNSNDSLSENLTNLSLKSDGSAKMHKWGKGREAFCRKRSSETELLNQETNKNQPETNMKDSKSCNDIKSGVPGSSSSILGAVDQRTSYMCAQLCSDMKVQLLKTYEEVVGRFGGHFDMSFMQACQDSEKSVQDSKDKEDDAIVTDIIVTKELDGFNVAGSNDAPADAVTNGDDCVLKNATQETNALSVPAFSDGFQVLEAAPDCHKFKLTMFQPTDPTRFYRTVRKEMKLLNTSLPSGIWVRGYEDRMDLYSVMIGGPERTPYEGGIFFFDFQLSADYPRAPPLCHYVTYCSDKLNPNLYEDGKVCVSLLGTWSGKGTEVWTSQSNLLQVIISIQGLILVSEPYFNEAGYERQKGTQQGRENSRMYNEMVVLKLIQAMSKVIQNPPEVFKEEIVKHFNREAFCLVSKLEKWLLLSENHNSSHPISPTTPNTFKQNNNFDTMLDLPEYPLIPASKGFCITLKKTLENFKLVLKSAGILNPSVHADFRSNTEAESSDSSFKYEHKNSCHT